MPESSCSREFQEAISSKGSIQIVCEACGRNHFVDNDLNPDSTGVDVARLVAEAEQHPNQYVRHDPADDDMISWFEWNGCEVVFDCPCGFAAKLEQTLWQRRSEITKYLTARAKRETAQLNDRVVELDSLRQALAPTSLICVQLDELDAEHGELQRPRTGHLLTRTDDPNVNCYPCDVPIA